MKQFIFFALLIFAVAVSGMSPQPTFEGKSVKELLLMLDSTNALTRTGAAAAIAWYLERDRFTPNFIDAPLIQETASRASQLLQTDKDEMVRLASISVLSALSNWTNTAPLLALGVVDNDCLVRVRVVSVLHHVCQDRGQKLGTNIVSALIDCLESSAEMGVLCEAASTAGELGKDARSAIPSLERLLQHKDKKVRECAAKALRKLRSDAN